MRNYELTPGGTEGQVLVGADEYGRQEKSTAARKEKLKGEIKMTWQDIESTAAALYDGGWVADDAEEIRKEYDIADSDLWQIVELLEEYAAKENVL